MAKIADVQEVSLEKLRPYERNAKKHGAGQIEKLKASILEFGFLTPCLIDSDYNLIAGHGRVMAAKELGIPSVPCVFIEGLTEEQRRAYILADNRLGELGEWDMDLVLDELTELDNLGFDIELTGFDLNLDDDIDVIDEDIPDVPVEPRSKIGDLYQLGKHRLMCGDSTDTNVIETLMGGSQADISFTSPPYNAGTNALGGNKHMVASKYLDGGDDKDDYDELLVGATDNMLMFSKWAFINLQMLANNKRFVVEWLNNYRDVLCDVAIWYKTIATPAMAEKVMNSQFEFIFIFSKDNNSRAIGTRDFRGTVSNVYAGMPQRKNEYSAVHAATFPVEFAEHFVKNFTNAGDIVLDVFGGTGTTMIVCEQLDRSCYMCELDPKYIDVIIERWENLTGEKAVLLNG